MFHEDPLFKNLLRRFMHFNIYFSYCQKTSLLMPISFMKSHEIIMASTQNARAEDFEQNHFLQYNHFLIWRCFCI
ncbi:MAG: hypothetical protein DRP37_03880 [Thermodesulfobacteriota bacterium]|nr:MAG: hypothetical protein DRP37_03880 [Thermodesulfobacteriota bacterium]